MMPKGAQRLDQTEQRQQEQDMEFSKQQQGQQQTTSENEVKRVVKLGKAWHIVCDRDGHGILDKVFEVRRDKHNEVSMEARKGEFMPRHWKCNTKAKI